ncbi:MAG TPA: hypothetical protein VJN71_06995 [Nitrososphaerales archaeon]|nr:hypothetical protein [Nitrososphaerales archaeon]
MRGLLRALKSISGTRTSLATAAVVILLAFLLVSPFMASSSASGNPPSPATITKVHTGLVASDGLKSGNLNGWNMQGDAPLEHAAYKYLENSSGLYIGVTANRTGQWAGWFAETPKTYASLFSAMLTTPYASIPAGSFNTGMYVQTAAISNVNFVFCGAIVQNTGYYWLVESAKGNSYGVTSYVQLYESPTNSGPLTQDCTLVTNGNNSLSVYLGGSLVYSSQTLNLDIPPPFNAYLEVETTNSNVMLWGNYSDYYANSMASITVTGASPLGSVKLVNSLGGVIATSSVGSNGNATIPVGSYLLPLNATVNGYNSNGNLTASSFSPLSIWGGDVFAVSNSTSTHSSSSSALTNSSSTSSSTSTSGSTSSSTNSSTSSSGSTSSSASSSSSSTSTFSTSSSSSTSTSLSTNQTSTTTISTSSSSIVQSSSSSTTQSSTSSTSSSKTSASTSSSSTKSTISSSSSRTTSLSGVTSTSTLAKQNQNGYHSTTSTQSSQSSTTSDPKSTTSTSSTTTSDDVFYAAAFLLSVTVASLSILAFSIRRSV